MKKLMNLIRHEDREDGVIAIIVALALVALLGFTALAIDESSWLVTQRKYQNAADAAAMGAAAKRFKSNASQTDATDYARNIAALNDLNLTDREMNVTYDEIAKTATVIIRKPTDNYFSIALTGRDETMVSAKSTAGYMEIPGEDSAPFGANAAVESLKSLTWSGGNGSIVDGGMISGSDLNMHSGTIVRGGNVSGDGNVLIDQGVNFHAYGSVYSGGTMTLSTSDATIDGSVESKGDFKVTNGTTYTFGGNIKSNGTLNVNASAKVGGSLLSNGELKFDGQDIVVKGNAQSNSNVAINWCYPKIDGILYQYDNIDKQITDKLTKEDGSKADIQNNSEATQFTGIQHENYNWRWQKLESYLKYDPTKSNDEQPYSIADSTMFDNYVKDKYDGKTYNACISYWDGNYTFYTGSNINEFLQYCRDHGKGDGYPVYFPGSITLNEGTPVEIDGAVVVEKDFTWNSPTTAQNPGGENRIALVSLNGNITLGNYKNGNVVNGAVFDLNNEGNIQMNGSGDVYGGVVSKGTITMNGVWNVTGDTKWEAAIKPITVTTKKLVRIIN